MLSPELEPVRGRAKYQHSLCFDCRYEKKSFICVRENERYASADAVDMWAVGAGDVDTVDAMRAKASKTNSISCDHGSFKTLVLSFDDEPRFSLDIMRRLKVVRISLL